MDKDAAARNTAMSKSLFVKIVGAADGTPTPHDGRFVKSWNADTDFGILDVESTDDISEALRFSGLAEAHEQWSATSSVQPTRPTDGKPNRPLTALTIEFEKSE